MTSTVTPSNQRLRAPLIGAALTATFAAGLVTGISLPRTPPDRVVASTSFKGVADNNMSDAVRRITNPDGPWFKGVADNNMSDAVRRALYGPPAD
jgi:hypothetical protein